MTADEAIKYIENYDWSKTRLGLERTRELLHLIGDPQKELKFIHVAGSNGKGSFCAMTEAVLRAAGYKTGLYISPYIERFNERIKLSGEDISDEDLAAVATVVSEAAESMEDHPSQFELVTALGFEYFRRKGCDIVVLEVGMGGELDSTNAIDSPELAVIMNLGLEHTEYLGDTLSDIARAKAGIIKPGTSCVYYGDLPEEAFSVVRGRCEALKVPIFSAESFPEGRYELSLYGPHQKNNAAVVLKVVEVLRSKGYDIPEEAVAFGLSHTYWPARFETLSEDPVFILDGAHNPQCAEALRDALSERFGDEKTVFLCGILADKDYESMIELVAPFAERFYCLTPLSERALPASELAKLLRSKGIMAEACSTIEEGIEKALLSGKPVVAFGSLYLAGAVRSSYLKTYKARLRAQKIAARDGLSPETRRAKSEKICEEILRSEEYGKAKKIMIYKAVKGEVSLEALERENDALPEGERKLLCYPLCVGKELSVIAPGEGEDAWKRGAFGIPEPVVEKGRELYPEELDLVILPCTSFDSAGGRLGMGGGYYDRLLPKLSPKCVTIAVAFEEQRSKKIPCEPFDRGVDRVVPA